MRTTVVALVVMSVATLPAQDPKTAPFTPEERKLAADAEKLNREVIQLFQRGQAAEAIGKAREALAIREKLYPAARYPAGHPALADSITNLGGLLQAIGRYEEALPLFERSLAMTQKQYPTTKFPDGHPELAVSINNMGFLLQKLGAFEKALTYQEQALTMFRKVYPESKFPDGHPELAIGMFNQGTLLQSLGSYEKALPLVEQSVAMFRKLYPESKYRNGHPDLANALNNLGTLLDLLDLPEKALPYVEEALAMRRKLYPRAQFPDGHPELADGLSNLGDQLNALGQFSKALPHLEQAVAMYRKLYPKSEYPDGHPNLINGLNNLGGVFVELGTYDKAIECFEQALDMKKKLHPKTVCPHGHPQIAAGLSNLGGLLYAMGSHDKALLRLQEALAMYRSLGKHSIATSSEAEALALGKARPRTRDALLSLMAHVPDSAAAAYDAVWDSKSAVTRLLALRQAAARASGAEHAAQLEKLASLRRRVDQLLQDRDRPAADRDKLLAAVADERDALERALATAIPMTQRARELEDLRPSALMDVLGDGTVFIDFVTYTRFEQDKAKPGRDGATRTRSYVAFVLTKGQTVRRVDLGDADRIDRAIREWRGAIEKRASSPAAQELHELVWAKLAKHVPADAKTLYLSPDGDLARLPWAALPVAQNRVLLEDFAIATVPHGPFLFEALKYPREYRGVGATLLLGDVDYAPKKLSPLPAAAVELDAIRVLVPGAHDALRQRDATPQRLKELLPKVRYAHCATHGYFDAETLNAEQQRAIKALAARRFGDDSRAPAAKNPLAFTGLVLSGGEVFSALTILDLKLDDLKLVTLSACETGLGGYTGGEGVQGLQRAFHLAGCPNVIGSLWQVNDEATAALMRRFYFHLWEKKEPPIQALRLAQLELYRNPAQVADLLRGNAPKFSGATKPLAKEEAPKDGERAATKLWAAFVLSGVGW